MISPSFADPPVPQNVFSFFSQFLQVLFLPGKTFNQRYGFTSPVLCIQPDFQPLFRRR
jgi:hypothetical protein